MFIILHWPIGTARNQSRQSLQFPTVQMRLAARSKCNSSPTATKTLASLEIDH